LKLDSTFDTAIKICEHVAYRATLLVRKSLGPDAGVVFAWCGDKLLYRAIQGDPWDQKVTLGEVDMFDVSIDLFSHIEYLASGEENLKQVLAILEKLRRLERGRADELSEWLLGTEPRPLRFYNGFSQGYSNPSRDRFDIECLREIWGEST
jgi:hypothetical protein